MVQLRGIELLATMARCGYNLLALPLPSSLLLSEDVNDDNDGSGNNSGGGDGSDDGSDGYGGNNSGGESDDGSGGVSDDDGNDNGNGAIGGGYNGDGGGGRNGLGFDDSGVLDVLGRAMMVSLQPDDDHEDEEGEGDEEDCDSGGNGRFGGDSGGGGDRGSSSTMRGHGLTGRELTGRGRGRRLKVLSVLDRTARGARLRKAYITLLKVDTHPSILPKTHHCTSPRVYTIMQPFPNTS